MPNITNTALEGAAVGLKGADDGVDEGAREEGEEVGTDDGAVSFPQDDGALVASEGEEVGTDDGATEGAGEEGEAPVRSYM